MKKYVKPEIYFESFQLSQHIAACGWDMSNAVDVKQCTSNGDNQDVYSENDFIAAYGPVFVDVNASCVTKHEAYCYTNGSNDAIRVFNSQ